MQTKSNPVFRAVRKRHIAMSAGIILVLVACILGGTIWKSPIIRQLTDWKILARPEQLTELYFAQPTHLPTTYAPATSQVVTFVVHNAQSIAANYSYQIRIEGTSPLSSHVLAKGSLFLQPAQQQTISQTVLLPNASARAKVTVSLSSGQTISYWVIRK